MGKRRKMGKPISNKSKSGRGTRSVETTEDNTLDPNDRSFIYDEVDDFHDAHEDALLRDVTFKKPRPVELEQVLGVEDSSDSNVGSDDSGDEDEIFMDDDIVETTEQKLPDERVWGTNKRTYFGTDTTDDKIMRTVKRGKTEQFSKLEEAAARRFQGRLDAQIQDLPEDDLLLQVSSTDNKSKIDSKLSVGVDLTTLTEKQKRRLLKQHSPEFYHIVQDFNEKQNELTTLLEPLMEARNAGKITQLKLNQYISTRYQLISQYIVNICAYFMLKCETTNLSHHPVITRLTQYRTQIKKLDVIHASIIDKLNEILSLWKAGKPLGLPIESSFINKSKKANKLLNILGGDATVDDDDNLSELLNDSDIEKDKQKDNTIWETNNTEEGSVKNKQDANSDSESSESVASNDENERRGITYKMSKNKGLIPSRRRDQQNPRVKYRMKYTKKLKLRKGQVRQVRKEEQRYTGERSGINVRSVKSIKLK